MDRPPPSRRLVDRHPVGSAVEIALHGQWLPGVVVQHDHPGLWVRLSSGDRAFFVTNGRHIRTATPAAAP